MAKEKRILDLIDGPSDLRYLNCEELSILATEIREEIVSVTSQSGGHVSSALGAVELILSVHSLINSPKDKFIFDVGHQSYTHKLITGRRDKFKTLRKFDGISGFTKPSESIHDVYYSGHASDSLSMAMGLAQAKKLRGSNEKIVVLIGDAAIAGGMAFEALNQIGQEGLPMVIILNDNKMSISESVGGFMKHLKSIRLTPRYKDARDTVYYGLKKFGSFGETTIRLGRAYKESLKRFLMPDSIMFEELGITYISTVDGHDIPCIRHAMRLALDFDGPVLIHAVTQKGAGYLHAEENPEKFHGIGPYDIKTGASKSKKTYTFTNAFEDTILDLAEKNDKIVALTAAMACGTGLKTFAKRFPDRFIDVGIAEEHLVASAAGLAKSGYKPFVAIYSAFLQRAIDQIITNVSIDDLNVVFCIDRAGIVGSDGVTHHGLYDISYCSMIPNFTVIAPSCAYELKCAILTAENLHGPVAIRYPRGCAQEINSKGRFLKCYYKNEPKMFKVGKSRTLIDGKDATILAFGESVADAIKAREKLETRGIYVRVVDMRFVKPLDIEAIEDAANNTKAIITVEDGILSGGAGQAVLAELNKLGFCTEKFKFKALGINDRHICHGDIDSLKKVAGIDYISIYKAVVSLVRG